jgi:acyl carrier protein
MLIDQPTQETSDRLLAIVERTLGAPATGSIPVDQPLNEWGMTSMKMLFLVLAVESEFGITIDQAEITPANFQSLTSIGALIDRLTGKPGFGPDQSPADGAVASAMI